MKKISAHKKQILAVTALASLSFMGTAQMAYANCVGAGATFTCSGATTTTQTIAIDDADVSTTAGFSLNNAGADGVMISGNGNLQYTDTNSSSITVDSGDGLSMITTGNSGVAGATHLDLGGNVTSTTGRGVYLRNTGDGAMNVNIASGTTVTGETIGFEINRNSDTAGGTLDLHGTITTTGIARDALVFSNLFTDMDVNLYDGAQIIGNTTDNAALAGASHFNVLGDFTTQGNFLVSDFNIASGKTLTISADSNPLFGDSILVNTMPASAGGILQFAIKDATHYGNISAINSGIDLTGMTVKAKVVGSGLVDGDMFLVADGAVDPLVAGPGGTRTAITDNSALWDFKMVDGTDGDVATYATNNLFLTTDNTDLWLVASAVSANFASQNTVIGSTVGTTLDAIASGAPTTGGLDSIVSGTSTGTEAIQSFTANTSVASSTVGSFSGLFNYTGVNQSLLEVFNPALTLNATPVEAQRPSSSRNTITPLNPDQSAPVDPENASSPFLGKPHVAGYGDALKEYSTWGQFFGQKIRQDARGGQPGYRGSIGGVVVGATTDKFLDKTTTGLSFTYGRSFIDGDGLSDAETGIDSYGVSLSALRNLGGGAYVMGLTSYVFNQLDTARHNIGGLGGLTANGEYNAHSFDAQLRAGKAYNVSGTSVRPALSLSVGRLNSDGYTETGAGGASLRIEKTSLNSASIGPSVDVSRSFADGTGNVATPGLQLGYSYDLLGNAVDTDSSFIGGGPAFSTQGLDPARHTLNLGLTMKYETAGGVDFDAAYNLQTKQDYVAHGASVRATVHF